MKTQRNVAGTVRSYSGAAAVQEAGCAVPGNGKKITRSSVKFWPFVIAGALAITVLPGAVAAPAQAATYATVICPTAMQRNMGQGDWGLNAHVNKVSIKSGKLVLAPRKYSAMKIKASNGALQSFSSKGTFKLAKGLKYYKKASYPGDSAVKFSSKTSKKAFLKVLKKANKQKRDKAYRLVFRTKNAKVVKIGFGEAMPVVTTS